jgi:transcriptional regulator with XRE-family HTH domain
MNLCRLRIVAGAEARPVDPSVREQKRYSQEGFARHAGLDRSYFGAIERGEFNISVATLAKIAAALGTTVAALCEKAKI